MSAWVQQFKAEVKRANETAMNVTSTSQDLVLRFLIRFLIFGSHVVCDEVKCATGVA
jgi:hypothetical protein